MKSWLIGKDPDAGKVWRQRRRGHQRMRRLDNITNSMDTNLSKLQETVKDRGAWGTAVYGVTKSQTRLSNWTTTTTYTLTLQFKPQLLCKVSLIYQEVLQLTTSITTPVLIKQGALPCELFFVAVFQSLSHVRLFTAPMTAACQPLLCFTVSWSLLKFMSMPWLES